MNENHFEKRSPLPTTPNIDAPSESQEAMARGWFSAKGSRAPRGLTGVPLSFIPQDVHTLITYTSAAACVAASLTSGDKAARGIGTFTGGLAISSALLTDYHLSLAKLIPIDARPLLDYGVGALQMAAPFLAGYRSRDRRASWAHIIGGAAVVLSALFTRYRAQKGVG